MCNVLYNNIKSLEIKKQRDELHCVRLELCWVLLPFWCSLEKTEVEPFIVRPLEMFQGITQRFAASGSMGGRTG
jgi:hypothetical protein